MFDAHIFDMIELGITDFKGVSEFSGPKKAIGSFPCMVFAGDLWETSVEHGNLRNMLLG